MAKSAPIRPGLAKQFSDYDTSHINENFWKIDRDRFLSFKPLSERLSSKYIEYEYIHDEEQFLKIAVRFLTRTAYSLFSFITNEKHAVLNLNLESGESFCGLDENIVQIGLGILTQKNLKWQERVDIVTALIYHEYYHKRFTVSDIKENLGLTRFEQYYNNPKVRKELDELFPTKLHGILNNILEDRREERLGTNDFPGYSFNLEVKRKYACFLHSEKVINPQLASGIILDYILIKILLPENEPVLFKEMKRYVDIGLVQFRDDPTIDNSKYTEYVKEFTEIEAIIDRLKKHIEANPNTVFSDDWNDILKETNDIYNLIPEKQRDKMEAMLSSKMFTLTEQLGSENKNQGERIKLTAEQIKMLQTIIANEIKKMEQEAAEENQNKSKKVFNEKINSKNNFTGYTHYQIIEEIQEPIDTVMLAQAKQISKNIVHNLGFLDSKYSRLNESYELTEGELDEDELYSIGLGNKFLFQDIEEIPAYNLDFGILLDESGSMNSKIREAKLAVLSLLLALKDNKHINLFVYGHTANEGEYSFGSSSNRSAIQIYKYFNTLERYTDWRNIFSADSRSNNADGFAIEKMGEIMKKSESRNKILIVVSDGQPNASGYGGDEAIAHTRSVVQQLEADGFTVIQICVDNVEASPRMFTHFVPYESDGKFFNNLKAILLQKLIQFADAV